MSYPAYVYHRGLKVGALLGRDKIDRSKATPIIETAEGWVPVEGGFREMMERKELERIDEIATYEVSPMYDIQDFRDL